MGCNFLYCASLKCRLEQNARGYCEMPIVSRPTGQPFFFTIPSAVGTIEMTVEETEGVIMCGTLIMFRQLSQTSREGDRAGERKGQWG